MANLQRAAIFRRLLGTFRKVVGVLNDSSFLTTLHTAMIKSEQEFHSANRLIAELRAQVTELRAVLSESYSRDIEAAIDERVRYIRDAEEEVAEYKACICSDRSPAVLPVSSPCSPRTYERGLFLSRLAKGLSQAEVAERLGCTQGRVSRWEGNSFRKSQKLQSGASDSPAPVDAAADIQLSTLVRWGEATGFSLSSYFIDRSSPPLNVQGIPALAFDLVAAFSQFASVPDAAVRVAMRSMKAFSDADCITCYIPDAQSNVLRLAFCEGVDHPEALAGLVWDENVPMSLLANSDNPHGEWISDVHVHAAFSGSLFVVRERIASTVYVLFDSKDGKGLLFLNYRNVREHGDHDAKPLLSMLSQLLSFFFTSVTHNAPDQVVPQLDPIAKRKHDYTAKVFVQELERYAHRSGNGLLNFPRHGESCVTYVLDHSNRVRDIIHPPEMEQKSKLAVLFRDIGRSMRELRLQRNRRTLIVDASDMPSGAVAAATRAIGSSICGVFASPLPGCRDDLDDLLIGLIPTGSGKSLTTSAYDAIIRAMCANTASQLLSIEKPPEGSLDGDAAVRSGWLGSKRMHGERGRSNSVSAIVANALVDLEGSSQQDRVVSACKVINKIYGAVATDLWVRDASGNVCSSPLAFAFESSWKKGRTNETIVQKIQPRHKGMTWKLLNEQSPNCVVIADATKDSQTGEGTQHLKLRTIIGIPVLGPTSLLAEAVAWIRFSEEKGQAFVIHGKGPGETRRESELRTIGSFLHLLAFSDSYGQLLDSSRDYLLDEYAVQEVMVNKRAFSRTSEVRSELSKCLYAE